MKDLKYFYRNGKPCATASSDDDITLFVFIGFAVGNEQHGRYFYPNKGVCFYHYEGLKFNNTILDQFWWMGTSFSCLHGRNYDLFLEIVDNICTNEDIQKGIKSDDNPSDLSDKGGFQFI